MIMSEKEFADFLRAHPEITFNEKTGHATHKKNNAVPLKNENDNIKPKRRKYRNVKVYEDEFGRISDSKDTLKGKCIRTFDSIKEFKRWCELSILQESGVISNLERQKKIIVQDAFLYKGKRISAITYIADFSYTRNGEEVVEDVKPFDEKQQRYLTTKDFNLKWKMLKAKYSEKSFEIY